MKEYKVLCPNCYNAIATYRNEEFLENLNILDNAKEKISLISSWMKECNLYVTEPKDKIYTLYYDDGCTEVLIEKEKKYGLIIDKIVEYYISEKINPLLKSLESQILCHKILSIKDSKIEIINNLVKDKSNQTKYINNKDVLESTDIRHISNISKNDNSKLIGKKYKKEDVVSMLSLATTEDLLSEIKNRISK